MQMSHQRRVLALLAVVHVLDHQSVVLLVGQNGVGLAGLQLRVVKHPADGDVVLRDAQLEHGRRPQQGRHVFGLLQDLDGCEEAEQSREGSGAAVWFDLLSFFLFICYLFCMFVYVSHPPQYMYIFI